MSPAVVNETVKAARDFIYPAGRKIEGNAHEKIAEFLDWSPNRVGDALAALSDIEEGAKCEGIF